MAVSRSQYTAARRLVRQNGAWVLRWLPKDVRECVEAVHLAILWASFTAGLRLWSPLAPVRRS